MQRYSLIRTNMPREFVLLQGKGCQWGKCTFCDYHTDTSCDPFAINRKVLKKVTGQYGVLDVINSGSAMELDESTISMLQDIVKEKGIKTVWFEAHYMYRNRLAAFASLFAPATVKFRCGVESFDPTMRIKWKKGVPASVTPEDIAKHFKGVCLLCCTTGDSKERILNDIETARKHFEYFSINLFCNNGTKEKRDEELAEWFTDNIYPLLKDCDGIEILLNNSDLGVG